MYIDAIVVFRKPQDIHLVVDEVVSKDLIDCLHLYQHSGRYNESVVNVADRGGNARI